MGMLLDSLWVDILAITVAVAISVVTYFKLSFTYWKKRRVPYLIPVFPFGTMENPLNRKKSLGFWIKDNYDELKSRGHKHGGLFNLSAPIYIPIDLEYVKNVMQKDFEYFVDRGIYYNEKHDPLSAHLFALGGEKWRKLRMKLTPSFTSGKMKMMFDTLVKCSYPMQEELDKLSSSKQPVDIKETAARFTTDIIGSCAFGLECNSFENSEAEFRKHGRGILPRSPLSFAKLVILLSNPKIGQLFGMSIIPKQTSSFFLNVIRDTVNYREQNNIVRKDMLQLMIDLKNNKNSDNESKHDGKSLSIEEIAAQAFVFFFAGFETSSTTMTYCMFELALNLDLQQKVRDEINQVLAKHDNKITYEAISEMKFMGQVIDETLRIYSPVTQITRKCVKDYKVPNTDVILEKGTNVMISTLGLHLDPEYFPDPKKFDPERFSENNKKKIKPFTYLPFGEGPRTCIGLRFGVMQTKVGLTVLLKNYKFSLNKNTTVPLEIDPFGIVYTTKGTVWLDSQKIN